MAKMKMGKGKPTSPPASNSKGGVIPKNTRPFNKKGK